MSDYGHRPAADLAATVRDWMAETKAAEVYDRIGQRFCRGHSYLASVREPDDEAKCSCPPDLLSRGGWSSRCPLHG